MVAVLTLCNLSLVSNFVSTREIDLHHHFFTIKQIDQTNERPNAMASFSSVKKDTSLSPKNYSALV